MLNLQQEQPFEALWANQLDSCTDTGISAWLLYILISICVSRIFHKAVLTGLGHPQ